MPLVKLNSSRKMIGLVILYSVLTNIAALTLLPTTQMLPPTTAPPSCFRDGKFYHQGQHYQPSPCEWCECVRGQEQCIFGDCLEECVDPIHEPNQCCPICPNGKNCYAGNKVIPAGVDVQVDEYTTCRCQERFTFGMSAHKAVCRVSLTTSPPMD